MKARSLFVAAALSLAACGGSIDTDAANQTSTLLVTATEALASEIHARFPDDTTTSPVLTDFSSTPAAGFKGSVRATSSHSAGGTDYRIALAGFGHVKATIEISGSIVMQLRQTADRQVERYSGQVDLAGAVDASASVDFVASRTLGRDGVELCGEIGGVPMRFVGDEFHNVPDNTQACAEWRGE